MTVFRYPVATIQGLRDLGPFVPAAVTDAELSKYEMEVLGRNDVDDGAFTGYRWDRASVDVDDGYFTLTPTGSAGAGRWKLRSELPAHLTRDFGGDLEAALTSGVPHLVLDAPTNYTGAPIVVAAPIRIEATPDGIVTFGTNFEGSAITFNAFASLSDVTFDGGGNRFVVTAAFGAIVDSGMIEYKTDMTEERVTYRNVAGIANDKIYGSHYNISSHTVHRACVWENLTTITDQATTGGLVGGAFIADDIGGADVLAVSSHTFDSCRFEDIYTLANGGNLFPDSDGIRVFLRNLSAANLATAIQSPLTIDNSLFVNVLKSAWKINNLTTTTNNNTIIVNDLKGEGQTDVITGARYNTGERYTDLNTKIIGPMITGIAAHGLDNRVEGLSAEITGPGATAINASRAAEPTTVTRVKNLNLIAAEVGVTMNEGILNIDGVTAGPSFGPPAGGGSIVEVHRGNSCTLDNVNARAVVNPISLSRGRNATSNLAGDLTIRSVEGRAPISIEGLVASNGTGQVMGVCRLENIDWRGECTGPFLWFADGSGATPGAVELITRNNRFEDTGSNVLGRLARIHGADLALWSSRGDEFVTSNPNMTQELIYAAHVGATDVDNMVIRNLTTVFYKLLRTASGTRVRVSDSRFSDANTTGVNNRTVDLAAADVVLAADLFIDCFESQLLLSTAATLKRVDDVTVRTTGTGVAASGGTGLTQAGTVTF